MNQDLLERILRCPTLPSLPAVAVRVIELTQQENLSLDVLARTLEQDQGLAARILRTVNSSFYALRRPCSTINQALVVLGLSAVKSLALSFSLVSTLNGSTGEGFDLVSYWRRGLYSAVAAKCIARTAGVLQEDEAFLGALLQDCGMFALFQALGPEYTRILAATGGDHRQLVKAEIAALELQHPKVGAMLVQRWRLPDCLVIPVRFHEQPTGAPAEYADLVRCVALGNIAHDLLTDRAPAPALVAFQARARDWFALDEAASDQMIRSIAESAKQLSSLFHLNTGRYADAEAIMAKAREQMAELAAKPHPALPLSGLLSDSDRTDPLTGAAVRDALLVRGEDAVQDALEAGTSIAVVEVAVDRFDALVSAGGSEAGDAVLVEIAALIEAVFTSARVLIARSGDASFTVLIPGMDRAAAAAAAAELRERITAESPVWSIPGKGAAPVSVSMGAAGAGPGGCGCTRIQELLNAARRAMESAAEAGGDRVRVYTRRVAA